jgi:hypothetical protein
MSKEYPCPLVDRDRNPVPIDEAALLRLDDWPCKTYNEVELIKEVRRLREGLKMIANMPMPSDVARGDFQRGLSHAAGVAMGVLDSAGVAQRIRDNG